MEESLEDSSRMSPVVSVKCFQKIISEHKDVLSLSLWLNSIINLCKEGVAQTLSQFTTYSDLWNQVNIYMTI